MGETSCEKRGWVKFSESKLIDLENKILQVVKTAFRTFFVPIGSTSINKDDKIWTILLNESSKNTPLILLHGFAAGLCFWCLNFDDLSKNRPVYAIDLLGFGRSSRPKFSTDSLEAEQQMVQSLEEWRKQVGLENFILLGHSFGGYLATSYTINHPQRVKHLILADPWGFLEQPVKLEVPLWLRTLGLLLYPFSHLNPLATVRAAGPIGPWLVRKVRQDISEKFVTALGNTNLIPEYIYQCNSQSPTGETAFHNMCKGFIWAKNPMMHRIHKITGNIPVTFLFGEKSWIRHAPEDILKKQIPNSFVNVEIIRDAGHHVNADQPKLFNETVNRVCQMYEPPLVPPESDIIEAEECLQNEEINDNQIKETLNEEVQVATDT